MNIFEKKIEKYTMKKLYKKALTENSLLFKGNKNLKSQKKTNQKKGRNMKHLKSWKNFRIYLNKIKNQM